MILFIKMDLALNNLQWLIYHKIKPNQTKIKPNQTKIKPNQNQTKPKSNQTKQNQAKVN